ncbi:ATP-binding protein [Ilyomonas limi]|uniref:ATP-binding protein n=1 Tax=Ilyomonas limi TaxID=2575867 RepID=A0A4U3KW02_9BACT|nr:ATP-binding protein [Ilyomonas limi]TKK66009.1 ATP-binding protein [Ilyomonas limi]
MQAIKKIVVIGPESTGKSMLCQLLAAHYGTIWCAEYAREYLLNNGTDYTYEDLLTIARGQLLLQEEAEKKVVQGEINNNISHRTSHIVHHTTIASPLLFIDTDLYVMKVWCEYVFGKCHQFILDEIVQRKYDLYLLCKPDIAWVKDELREYPDEQTRIELFHIYRDILINQNVPWAEVSGDYEQRLSMGIKAVEEILTGI